MEVGMLESIWDDANLKGVVRRAAYGEGDSVDGDTALVHTEIPPAHHVLVALILESELMRAFLVLYGYATCRLVHMPTARRPIFVHSRVSRMAVTV